MQPSSSGSDETFCSCESGGRYGLMLAEDKPVTSGKVYLLLIHLEQFTSRKERGLIGGDSSFNQEAQSSDHLEHIELVNTDLW
jgi:hypothetical protein